ncbi:hypothetical protein BGX26_009452, partial [Mortierella sp. AD094]
MKDIDFSRVGRKDFLGAPVLKLNVTSTDRDVRLLEVVKTVVDFLQVFERFYRQSLTSLFDDLAARYMIDALKSNELAERFEHAMARPGYNINNWKDIQSCVRSVFKMNNLQTELHGKLMTIRPYHREGIYDYTQRIKILVKGSGVDPTDRGVIRAIANTLPDQGMEKLI